MAHNYIVTAQKPTAVTACVTGKIIIEQKDDQTTQMRRSIIIKFEVIF